MRPGACRLGIARRLAAALLKAIGTMVDSQIFSGYQTVSSSDERIFPLSERSSPVNRGHLCQIANPMHLHHHAIIVTDMDEAIQNFCERLGQQLILRHPGKGEITEVAFVEEPRTGHRMELIAKPNGKTGELDHIAFEVENVDSEFERLTSAGLIPEDPPADVPQGAFLFKKIHSSSCRLAHLRDKNDLKIQIVHYD